MISKINFAGKVIYPGNSKQYPVDYPNEHKRIQGYANKKGVDVVVLDRSYYVNGTGAYDTITIKKDDTTGGNDLSYKHFDFMHPKKNVEKPFFISSTFKDPFFLK